MAKNEHLYNLGRIWAKNWFRENGYINLKETDYNFIQSDELGILIRSREHETAKHTTDEEVAISKRDYNSIKENFRKYKRTKNKLLIVRSYIDSATRKPFNEHCYFILIDSEILRENSYFYFKYSGNNGIREWESTGKARYYKWENNIGVSPIIKKNTIIDINKATTNISNNIELAINLIKNADDTFDNIEIKLRSFSIKNLYKISIEKSVTSSLKYSRNPSISAWSKNVANGICQLCYQAAPFHDKYGFPYLESHHIKWLRDKGEDSVNNIIALCPNCHRKMHALNLDKDVKLLFSRNEELVKLNTEIKY